MTYDWKNFLTFQHRDFLHKKARDLVDKYDAIGIEDISVKAMAKRKKDGTVL